MPKKYPTDQRDRALRMALERLDYPSPWAAAQALGPKLGVGPETLADAHRSRVADQRLPARSRGNRLPLRQGSIMLSRERNRCDCAAAASAAPQNDPSPGTARCRWLTTPL